MYIYIYIYLICLFQYTLYRHDRLWPDGGTHLKQKPYTSICTYKACSFVLSVHPELHRQPCPPQGPPWAPRRRRRRPGLRHLHRTRRARRAPLRRPLRTARRKATRRQRLGLVQVNQLGAEDGCVGGLLVSWEASLVDGSMLDAGFLVVLWSRRGSRQKAHGNEAARDSSAMGSMETTKKIPLRTFGDPLQPSECSATALSRARTGSGRRTIDSLPLEVFSLPIGLEAIALKMHTSLLDEASSLQSPSS